jgi:hypothetical protein
MLIILNPIEQAVARYVAKHRYEYCRKVNAVATRYGTEAEAMQREIDSAGAEIAYCKMMNVYPDMDVTKFPPYDAMLQDGTLVDVKQTDRAEGRLLVKMKERRKGLPDIYAMMVGAFPEYKFAGWVKATDILKEERIDKKLPHPAYVMEQSQLNR